MIILETGMNASKQTTYLSNTKLGYCSILLRTFFNFLNTSQDREKQVIRVVPLHPHSKYLGVLLRFERTFAKIITFGEAKF